jgi:hypothetical protein
MNTEIEKEAYYLYTHGMKSKWITCVPIEEFKTLSDYELYIKTAKYFMKNSKKNLLKTLANKEVIESSKLYLDLSDGLLNKIDLFFSNTNLDKKQQKQLMKIFEEIFSESYVESLTD